MPRLTPTVLLLAILAAGASIAPSKAAQTGFSGDWSVLISTSKGDCDKAYRYVVTVGPGGAISYGGQNDFTASGKVQPSGAVSVRISRGDQVAEGAGRLNGKSGSGTWQSPSGGCSGRWTAERRS